MTENMDTIIHKYFDNLIINPVALQNAFPKLSKKTGIIISGSVFGPDYYVIWKDYKYTGIKRAAIAAILKFSQKEINKKPDGTINIITFKHPSQVLFNKGNILTIGRMSCNDCFLHHRPSQIHPNHRAQEADGWWNNTECRRKRKIKVIKPSELCCGLRANGSRCTRRKKDGNEKFCGTHIKGTPHGTWD